ncbi:MAG: hypothetical protein KDN19_23025, partial [Verrucomicrobiae bacterium]|nr:hypothetical protein [Verrucomicrobiae bacterium]
TEEGKILFDKRGPGRLEREVPFVLGKTGSRQRDRDGQGKKATERRTFQSGGKLALGSMPDFFDRE